MLKLIIVDDEKPIRNFIKSMIPGERLKIEIAGEAADGIEGLELCLKVRPDIILTDIRMPGMDGLELLETVKRELPCSKVILISGYDEFAYAQKAVKNGATDYILKPVGEEDLYAVLEKAKNEVEQRKKEQERINRLKQEVKKLQDEVSGAGIKPEHFTGDHENIAIQKALEYIHDNYNSGLTLESVSEKVYMSSAYFCRLFKRELGKGFNEYISGLRMEKAKALLDIPGLKVGEISGMLGYADVSHFVKVFKKTFGILPSEYRSKNQKNNNIQ